MNFSLLCTLGQSWAVVPEAFLMGNGPAGYRSVVVLATSGIEQSVDACRKWFTDHSPKTRLRVFIIDQLPDIKNAEDHARYEEALFRVYADVCREGGPEHLHLCLAGGFKTISSSAHQTADLLGCARLFHITTPSSTPEHPQAKEIFAVIEAELREGRIHPYLHLIDLGSRPGWPTIQQLLSEAPVLPDKGDLLTVSNTAFREKILNRLHEVNRLAQSEHELATLPFAQIARWAPAARDWLQQPLNPETDEAWVRSLPKIDLHCHLGGFATDGELLHEVRAAAAFPDQLPPLNEPEPPPNWPLPKEPINLDSYMRLGDANGSALLKDPGCLKKHIQLLYRHFQEQNIVHAEVRCSPANYTSPGRSPWDVLNDIKTTFDECRAAAVAASVPLAEPVTATVPVEESNQQRTGGTLASTASTASTFIPFEKDASYHQTWRDLPHRHQNGATAFVTFRLADSLPASRLKAWHEEQKTFLEQHPKPWDESTWQEYRRRFPQRLEQWLDEAHGACVLRQPAIAAEVEAALRHFDGERYILDAWCIMPNHVHVLIKPLPGHDLESILHSWKSYTAKRINSLLRQSGQLWEHESFDHLLRNEDQLEKLRAYIRENPGKAGLENGFLVGAGTGLSCDSKHPACSVRETKRPAWSEPSGTLAPTPEPSQRLAPTIHLIIIGTRKKNGDHRTAILRHLMLAITAAEHWPDGPGCRVVGVDLAGFEDKETRAHYYRDDFRLIHRAGLALTVHAGENDEAEGIWSAVFDLNTRRIGHALSLIESPELLRSVADRRIGIEMCPYANYQIKGFTPMPGQDREYPLKHYLDAGIPVTVNTDNIGISAASLTDNFLLAARMCPSLTRLDILRLLRNAIDQSFLDHSRRLTLTRLPISHPCHERQPHSHQQQLSLLPSPPTNDRRTP